MLIKQVCISDTKELYNCICELFFQYSLIDIEMLRMFRIENFLIIEYKFKTIRFDLSLYYWYNVERLQVV